MTTTRRRRRRRRRRRTEVASSPALLVRSIDQLHAPSAVHSPTPPGCCPRHTHRARLGLICAAFRGRTRAGSLISIHALDLSTSREPASSREICDPRILALKKRIKLSKRPLLPTFGASCVPALGSGRATDR